MFKIIQISRHDIDVQTLYSLCHPANQSRKKDPLYKAPATRIFETPANLLVDQIKDVNSRSLLKELVIYTFIRQTYIFNLRGQTFYLNTLHLIG